MKPSKILNIGLLLVILATLTGCGSYYEYFTRSYKYGVNSATFTKYNAKKYEVLGVVQAKAESVEILCVYAKGTEGQALLWDAAVKKYGDQVSGIKDISAVYDYVAIIPPIYSKITTTYVGTAVKEK